MNEPNTSTDNLRDTPYDYPEMIKPPATAEPQVPETCPLCLGSTKVSTGVDSVGRRVFNNCPACLSRKLRDTEAENATLRQQLELHQRATYAIWPWALVIETACRRDTSTCSPRQYEGIVAAIKTVQEAVKATALLAAQPTQETPK